MIAGELPAAEHRWAQALEAWAIPPRILAAAPEDPWGLPVERFAGRADRAVKQRSGASFEQAQEFIAAVGPLNATVLDVGAGAGAASLPHAADCSLITALDANSKMLKAFAQRADAIGVAHREVVGSWPQNAAVVEPVDVALCHHVVYNVADIGPFLRRLTGHARIGVVLELPPAHPLTWMNPLWERFHDLTRPATPTVDDLVTILTLERVRELRVQRWSRFDPVKPDGDGEESIEERAVLVARRLCLTSDRVPDVVAALDELTGAAPENFRDLVTVSWMGTAD